MLIHIVQLISNHFFLDFSLKYVLLISFYFAKEQRVQVFASRISFFSLKFFYENFTPMTAFAESVSKVTVIIKKMLTDDIARNEKLNESVNKIQLLPFVFSETLPKIMVITMPNDLLIHTQANYSSIIKALNKEFPKYIVLVRREGDIPSPKVFTPIRLREDIISDLVFPATVTGRTNEVESRQEQTQVVYLDNKNVAWSKDEMISIEKLLTKVMEQNFKIRLFGA